MCHVLSLFNYGDNVSVESRSGGGFDHDEGEVTIIAYLHQVADEDKVICILCDDTDVLVDLLGLESWLGQFLHCTKGKVG